MTFGFPRPFGDARGLWGFFNFKGFLTSTVTYTSCFLAFPGLSGMMGTVGIFINFKDF